MGKPPPQDEDRYVQECTREYPHLDSRGLAKKLEIHGAAEVLWCFANYPKKRTQDEFLGSLYDVLEHVTDTENVLDLSRELTQTTVIKAELKEQLQLILAQHCVSLDQPVEAQRTLELCVSDLTVTATFCLRDLMRLYRQQSPRLRRLVNIVETQLELTNDSQGYWHLAEESLFLDDPSRQIVYLMNLLAGGDFSEDQLDELLGVYPSEFSDNRYAHFLATLAASPKLDGGQRSRIRIAQSQLNWLKGKLEHSLALLAEAATLDPGNLSILLMLHERARFSPPLTRWTRTPLKLQLLHFQVPDQEELAMFRDISLIHPGNSSRLYERCLELVPAHTGCLTDGLHVLLRSGPLERLNKLRRLLVQALAHPSPARLSLLDSLLDTGDYELLPQVEKVLSEPTPAEMLRLWLLASLGSRPERAEFWSARLLALHQNSKEASLCRAQLVVPQPGTEEDEQEFLPSYRLPRPHVVFVTIDAQNYRHLGCYGYPRALTPNLDALAKKSMVYERAYSAAPHTLHSGLVFTTGLYLHTLSNDPFDKHLEEHFTTMAEYFQGAGYTTVAVVGNDFYRRGSGFEQGFDQYYDNLENVSDRTLASLALHRFALAVGERPTFLWLHLYGPHAPYTPPFDVKVKASLYPTWSWPSPLFQPFPTVTAAKATLGSDIFDGLHLAPTWYFDRYDEEVQATDQALAPLLDRILNREDTLLVVTADHGESMGEHRSLFAHDTCLYDEEIRVPLIVFDPRSTTIGRVVRPVGTIDILPTLLERVGIQHEALHGQHLGASRERVMPILAQRFTWDKGFNFSMMLVDRERKMILSEYLTPQRSKGELYALRDDPYEQRNLWDTESRMTATLTDRARDVLRSARQSNASDGAEVPQDFSVRLEKLRFLGYLE